MTGLELNNLNVEPESLRADRPSYEVNTTASAPWAPARIIDTERMPFTTMRSSNPDPEAAKYPLFSKNLFANPDTQERLIILYVPPGWPGGYLEYHTYPEWAFNFSGDIPNDEAMCSTGHFGPLNRFKEGCFLDRPPYSLHGGEKDLEFMRSQMGGAAYHMVGGVNGKSYSPDPRSPSYNPEYTRIKSWAVPRVIDTIEHLPWEPYKSVAGLYTKILTDDPGRGFRCRLWRLDPGWQSAQSPEFARAFYYKQGYQFVFILVGDLNIQTYSSPGQKGEKVTLKKYFHVERAPMSIIGLADGTVTELGCVWFEVTYAKGTSVSNTPIEEPSYA